MFRGDIFIIDTSARPKDGSTEIRCSESKTLPFWKGFKLLVPWKRTSCLWSGALIQTEPCLLVLSASITARAWTEMMRPCRCDMMFILVV